MKIRIGTFILAILFGGSIMAQGDKISDDILKGVSAKYKTFASINAEFTYSIENPQDKANEKQTGKVFLKGNKYKLLIAGQEVYCDGATVWTYLKDSKEVQITDPNTKADAISPATIFTMYDKGYSSKFVEEKTDGGKAVQIIDLTPIDKKKKFFKIRLTINKLEKLIVSSKIFDKNGNKINYTIDKFSHDTPISDSIFTFVVGNYPGIEVIDLKDNK
ncbi:MAG: outer membrane lipoprotein carrier protein LolA [Bacteroidota bacterium]